MYHIIDWYKANKINYPAHIIFCSVKKIMPTHDDCNFQLMFKCLLLAMHIGVHL